MPGGYRLPILLVRLGAFSLIVSDCRTTTIDFENRVTVVESKNTSTIAALEDRCITIEQENRSIVVGLEDRTITVVCAT